MKVLFAAGFGPIVRDDKESVEFYLDTLGIPVKEEHGYFSTEAFSGVKHFALWPLSHAAQDCFGTNEWPKDISIPQSWMELDVESVEEATKELEEKGYKLLVSAKKEPWGQTVTRLISPEGFLIGITYTPWLRDKK